MVGEPDKVMKRKEQIIIKSIFLFFLVNIILFLVVGIYGLRNNYYLRNQYFLMQWQFLKTKFHYLREISRKERISWINKFVDNQKDSHITLASSPSIPVFLYHGVIADPAWQPDGVNISQSDFEKQMIALKKSGYHTITLQEFSNFVKGKESLPPKSILLTFDDSRKDSFYNADPILHALKFQAVMFVITNRSLPENNQEHPFHLSPVELKKMLSTGRWEVGSHMENGHDPIVIDQLGTRGNFLSNKQYIAFQERWEKDKEYAERIAKDLEHSKVKLANNLSVLTDTLAIPFGDYGQNFSNFPKAKELILPETQKYYSLVFRQSENDEYPNNYPQANNFLVKRINVNSTPTSSDLLILLDNNSEKELPFQDNFRHNKGWYSSWGKTTEDGNSLVIESDKNNTGSLSFLSGTYLWQDYSLLAKLKILKGDAFSAVVRYNDSQNYVSCDFSSNGFSLSEVVASKEFIINESEKKILLDNKQEKQVGVIVQGNQVKCLLDGELVAQGIISPSLTHGGIGFKTWNNQEMDNQISISQVNISLIPLN